MGITIDNGAVRWLLYPLVILLTTFETMAHRLSTARAVLIPRCGFDDA